MSGLANPNPAMSVTKPKGGLHRLMNSAGLGVVTQDKAVLNDGDLISLT